MKVRTWFRSRWDASHLVSALKMPCVRASYPNVGIGDEEYPWEISVSTGRRFFASSLLIEFDRATIVDLSEQLVVALSRDLARQAREAAADPGQATP